MNREHVLRAIRALRLPRDQYVVVGGAALAARGIRETRDIDLVVTSSLFDRLERAGWRRKVRPNGKPGLCRGKVEAYRDVNCDGCAHSTRRLIQRSESVDGVPVIDMETLAGFKRAYGRAKDLRDLLLINKYIESYAKLPDGGRGADDDRG